MGTGWSTDGADASALPSTVLTVSPSGATYTTITAAIAAWSAGSVVRVWPGTYAENPGALPDGIVIDFVGNPTVGTAGGPVFTVASPGTGEVATLTGSATISATAAMTVAAGAVLEIDPGIALVGTTAGPWRVGTTLHLASGDAIATYAPADGSLCAVAEGDELWFGTNNVELHMETVGGTDYWVGDDISAATAGAYDAPTNISSGVDSALGISPPTWATGIIAREIHAYTYQYGGTLNAGNCWTGTFAYNDVNIGAGINTGTVPDTASIYTIHRQAVGPAYVALRTDGETFGAGPVVLPSIRWAKVGTPGNFIARTIGLLYAPVVE